MSHRGLLDAQAYLSSFKIRPTLPALQLTARLVQSCGRSVIREEVIPLIERSFSTTPERALMGHSTAALFTLFVLFDSPDLFQKFSSTSPGPGPIPSLLAREAALATRRPTLNTSVYFAVGGNENPPMHNATTSVVERLQSRAYPGLKLTVETLDGEGHVSPVHFWHALQWLYPEQVGRR